MPRGDATEPPLGRQEPLHPL